ncbi:hypothetical protein KG091_07715 [Carnobacteriaceae bacterium zg-ZUI78]|nr:hypothetical protein [Carnobacteriaceae bacterium zg-ZUI78]
MVQATSHFSGTYGHKFELKLILENRSTNINNNTSTVRAEVWYRSLDSYSSVTWYGTDKPLTVNIAGTRDIVQIDPNIAPNQNRLIFSKDYVIRHNPDGTHSGVSGSAQFEINITNIGSASVSTTLSLSNIPAKSDYTWTGTDNTLGTGGFYIGDTPTLQTRRKSASFYDTITFYINNTVVASRTNLRDFNGTITFTQSEIDAFYRQMGTSEQVRAFFVLETFTASGDSVGRSYEFFNIGLPNGITPTIGSITVQEINAKVSAILPAGNYLQNLSRFRVTVNNPQGARGSTIQKIEVTLGDITKQGNITEFDAINQSGSVTVTAKITDNRGRSGTKTTTIQVKSYTPPTISIFEPHRLANGTGNTLQAQVSVTASSVIYGGVNKNPVVIKAYRLDTSSVVYQATATNGSLSTLAGFTGTYAVDKSFTFRLDVTDKFNSISALRTVGTSDVIMDWGTKSVGIGMIVDETDSSRLQVRGGIKADGGSITSLTVETLQNSRNTDEYITRRQIIDLIYPIGIQIQSSNRFFDPNKSIPGTTWKRALEGRFPVGYMLTNTNFISVGKTGGSVDLPLPIIGRNAGGSYNGFLMKGKNTTDWGSVGRGWHIEDGNEITPAIKKPENYDKLPPYQVVVFWERTR